MFTPRPCLSRELAVAVVVAAVATKILAMAVVVDMALAVAIVLSMATEATKVCFLFDLCVLFDLSHAAVPALVSRVNAAVAQAAGRWFGAAARTRRSFFRSVTADVGVAVAVAVAIDAVATAVAVAIDAVATTVAVAIDVVAAAVAVPMTVAVAMAVVDAVANAKDISFVA